MKPKYALRRCRKDGMLYGQTHGSDDAMVTFCGWDVNDTFYITDNTATGVVTCRECLRVMKVEEP